jgi:hypothetical protein
MSSTRDGTFRLSRHQCRRGNSVRAAVDVAIAVHIARGELVEPQANGSSFDRLRMSVLVALLCRVEKRVVGGQRDARSAGRLAGRWAAARRLVT